LWILGIKKSLAMATLRCIMVDTDRIAIVMLGKRQSEGLAKSLINIAPSGARQCDRAMPWREFVQSLSILQAIAMMIGVMFGLRPSYCGMVKKYQKRALVALKAVIGSPPQKSLFGR
jgi:hypothetical protein